MPEIRWFDDSPDAGDPACICSWCGEQITEVQAPAIRVTTNNLEARFHGGCWTAALMDAPRGDDGTFADGLDYGPACEVCGCEMMHERCDQCGGEGVNGHDCGDDTCCCLHPEDNMRCEQCDGQGGWWLCPNASAHPENPEDREAREQEERATFKRDIVAGP